LVSKLRNPFSGIVESLRAAQCGNVKPLDECGLVYIAKYDPGRSTGIRSKIISTLKAAEAMGYTTRNINELHDGGMRFRHIVREIVAANEKYLFVRSFTESNLFLIPALLLARLQGKVIIVDIPTPHKIAAKEIWQQPSPLASKLYRVGLLFLGGSYSLWPASTIIQHADESFWFSFGNKRKTIKMGNGVDLDRVPLRDQVPQWPAKELRLVAVATVAFWHGYDRLIRAVNEWVNDPTSPYGIHLTIIGDGRALDGLKSQVEEAGIGRFVSFTGMMDQTAINDYFTKSHLAVGSLGIHRKGLTESSELKAREYCAAGIPFVASGSDPDFPSELPFRVRVSLGESTDDLKNLFREFGELTRRFTTEEMRQYAETQLSYRSKLRKIGIPERR
jgi:glycosyltransferase involved in cell wall biosynthesis